MTKHFYLNFKKKKRTSARFQTCISKLFLPQFPYTQQLLKRHQRICKICSTLCQSQSSDGMLLELQSAESSFLVCQLHSLLKFLSRAFAYGHTYINIMHYVNMHLRIHIQLVCCNIFVEMIPFHVHINDFFFFQIYSMIDSCCTLQIYIKQLVYRLYTVELKSSARHKMHHFVTIGQVTTKFMFTDQIRQ